MNLQNQSKNPQAFQNVSQNEKSMAMLMWILTFFTGFVGPLIIWIIKKDESSYLNKQGKNYINYAISYGLYGVGALILTAVLIGYLLLFVLSIVCLVYTILAIVTVNKGEDYVVPFTIEIIK
ncbi:DUF4870 domain-containing protein [Staphylococcus devriesei]|uniref:DUF4870 domain-containing protein n=1 Tax=Staphylococcus devriesei TaxID=586733 RepID=A0A2T4KW36_9STAP|nr:DUF4870 domain-containing protein [Staphylococcus devriesei]MCE5090902.1 DUF4870 domain-containing protein [Staphylococcus devriesei]MCE5097270.1 DUF4870 domain-containing protein [Staphylococcus devriesei]PTE70376.1 DUF4870 domain-containing protein [Staphylococcus devriesei]PTF03240.1 DUF4870 domain-containing protein [Staphylococcus devriesei]PTF11022.1 DUF4870 domain-containing protein [Staphylococcus devriesei]